MKIERIATVLILWGFQLAGVFAQSDGFSYEPNDPFEQGVWHVSKPGIHAASAYVDCGIQMPDYIWSPLEFPQAEWELSDVEDNVIGEAWPFDHNCSGANACDDIVVRFGAGIAGNAAYQGWARGDLIYFGARLKATTAQYSDESFIAEHCEPNAICCIVMSSTTEAGCNYGCSSGLSFYVTEPGYIHIQAGTLILRPFEVDQFGTFTQTSISLGGPGYSRGEDLELFADFPEQVTGWSGPRVVPALPGRWTLIVGEFFAVDSSVCEIGETAQRPSEALVDVILRFSEQSVQFYLYGDENGDGDTDVEDLSAVLDAFGTIAVDTSYDPRCDFDGNGAVDIGDLNRVLENFGT